MSDRRIVERLREWPLSEKLALEAADRIEALEAALRELLELHESDHQTDNDASIIDFIRTALVEGQDK
jgi:hypothetical protein